MSKRQLKTGEIMRDKDPRMGRRLLKIVEVLPKGVAAIDGLGKTRLYLRKHIHTDGKPRSTGFSIIGGGAK